jgi:uncharacterized protein YegJ (DUF2314 family)
VTTFLATLFVFSTLLAGCRRTADDAPAARDPRVAAVSPDGDTARFVNPSDYRWARARQDAQCSLPGVHPPLSPSAIKQSDLQLKAALELAPRNIEHLWVRVLAVNSDTLFRGTINNDPSDSTRYPYGDTVTVRAQQVTDWYAVDRDTLVGGFTMRVARLELTREERAVYDSAATYVIGSDEDNLRRMPRRCGGRAPDA